VSVASIGWDIGSCPEVDNPDCANTSPIANCADIGDCLICGAAVAMDQIVALYYATLNLPSSDPSLNRCQVAIGKAATKFSMAKLKHSRWRT
jgi:hypothetical protein